MVTKKEYIAKTGEITAYLHSDGNDPMKRQDNG